MSFHFRHVRWCRCGNRLAKLDGDRCRPCRALAKLPQLQAHYQGRRVVSVRGRYPLVIRLSSGIREAWCWCPNRGTWYRPAVPPPRPAPRAQRGRGRISGDVELALLLLLAGLLTAGLAGLVFPHRLWCIPLGERPLCIGGAAPEGLP